MAEIITKDVLTLEELKTVTGQEKKAMVVYDVSTGEPNGLDVEVLIRMDASIGEKVDKVPGKSLISDTEIARLASVTNQTLSGLGGAPLNNPTFTGNVVVPPADSGTEAVQLQQMQTADALLQTQIDNANLGWYGVQWDTTVADSALTRIGNMAWHKSLPIQSGMKRVILDDLGDEVYSLGSTNSLYKWDGSTASVLDGADGQVMVLIPAHYEKFETEGTVNRAKMSPYYFSGSTYFPKIYISAYEASLNRSTLKLSSVVNLTADYRGGNNISAWDAASNTLLGKPVTNISLTNFRTYARNRGSVNWNCNAYIAHKVMYWLYVTEYANFNCQLAFNAALTAEGYHQGGLGDGVTTLDYTKWTTFNNNNPVVPCGITNPLGNATGVVNYNMPAEYDSVIKTVPVPSYRGIENPFGHIWKWTDGVKVKIQSNSDGGLSELYVCLNPVNYQDTNYNNYIKQGILPRTSGYGGKAIFGAFGEMLPKDVIGSSTTYLCDYFYTSIPASGTEQQGLLFCGTAAYGAYAGCAFATSNNSPADAHADVGSRLCFLNL